MVLPPTPGALCCEDITIRMRGNDPEFIIKSTFFVLKIKDAGEAETEYWICFYLKLVDHAPIT